MTSRILEAADRLRRAAQEHRPCPPVRDLIGPSDVPAAYAVQRELTRARLAAGAHVVGHKIGLTSPAVQRQLGVDRPDFGVLFADMAYSDGAKVPMGRLLQPRAEAEVAFVLGRDLDEPGADVRAAVAYAVPALEIVDSRIAGWDISFADTVADNASSGLFVLGETLTPLERFEPVEAAMSMTLDGEIVSTGTGADCLGDPLQAVAWLAETARDHGDPLRAGQIVLSGALGPMRPVESGNEVAAHITGLGAVRAVFV
ncbi:MAG TPA: fumarylacetoacetate hydrolase family protein [Actinoplanes sp.]